MSSRDWQNRCRIRNGDEFKAVITAVSAIQLSNITLVASDRQSYDVSAANVVGIERWLSREDRAIGIHDLVQGEAYEGVVKDRSDSSDERAFTLRVAKTEPVSQGYLVSGKTRFAIIYEPSVPPGTSLRCSDDLLGNGATDNELLIDENFLGSNVVLDLSVTFENSASSPTLSSPYGQQTNYRGPFQARNLPTTAERSIQFSNHRPEEDHTIFVHPDTLGKLGVFDEDWVNLFLTHVIRIDDSSDIQSRFY